MEDMLTEERLNVKRLELEKETMTKLLEEKTKAISKKEEQLKEFYIYNLTKKNQELQKQVDATKFKREPPPET